MHLYDKSMVRFTFRLTFRCFQIVVFAQRNNESNIDARDFFLWEAKSSWEIRASARFVSRVPRNNMLAGTENGDETFRAMGQSFKLPSCRLLHGCTASAVALRMDHNCGS